MRRTTALPVAVFDRRLSWSISSHFVVIQSWFVPRSRKSQKNINTLYFEGSKLFKVIDFSISKKLVTSGCYDK